MEKICKKNSTLVEDAHSALATKTVTVTRLAAEVVRAPWCFEF